MLKYPKVYTNTVLKNNSTMPLELRAGIERTILKTDDVTVVYNPEDGAHIEPLSGRICKEKYLSIDRQLRDPEFLILQGSEHCSISINNISNMSLRPSELRYVIDEVGLYFIWFNIGSSTVKYDYFRQKYLPNIISSCWVDGFNHQVKLRSKSLVEIAFHCEKGL